MTQSKRSFGVNSILVILVVAFFCSFVFLIFVSFPPTEAIARRYLDAVVHKDFGGAMSLAGADQYCQAGQKSTALKHIDQFGGAEVRNVAITVKPGAGSDEELQLAEVVFEYRRTNQTEWSQGLIVLMTDHAVPGFRYACGGG